MRNRIHLLDIIFPILLLSISAFLLLFGTEQYRTANYDNKSLPQGIIILGENTTKIKNMTISISEKMAANLEKGWMGVYINLVCSSRNTDLLIDLPSQIDFVSFTNHSYLNSFYHMWSYNKTTDRSNLYFAYRSPNEENDFMIVLDWKAKEKISYDQERVAIAFDNPFFGKPVFRKVEPLAGLAWIPEIDQIIILVEGDKPLDSSLTLPPSSYPSIECLFHEQYHKLSFF